MRETPNLAEDLVIQQLIRWGAAQGAVRALLLFGSRAAPDAPVDHFSDYDVILAVRDIYEFYPDDSWLADFGTLLVVYRDPIRRERGLEQFGRVTQYEAGTKIDFGVCPVTLLRRIAADAVLPDHLDAGYVVLLDKDGLATALPPPTYRAYIPTPPSPATYRALVDEFFNETHYVARNLRRDELLFAKYNLDHMMKFQLLRRMLEWRIEIDHDWSLKTGAYGKGLERRLPPALWSELEATYVGAGEQENWEALFRTIALFRQVAIQVAEHLGYTYPHDLDRRVVAFLRRLQPSPYRGENDESTAN